MVGPLLVQSRHHTALHDLILNSHFAGINGLIRSLANLESAIGVRVNGVAPGVIKTPLWTDHAEKLVQVDPEKDVWVEPEEVADAMLRCVEEEEIGGGYVMEVTKGKTRSVGWRMDPGPMGEGATVANRDQTDNLVLEWLAEEGWGVEKK